MLTNFLLLIRLTCTQFLFFSEGRSLFSLLVVPTLPFLSPSENCVEVLEKDYPTIPSRSKGQDLGQYPSAKDMNLLPTSSRKRLSSARSTLSSLLLSNWSSKDNLLKVRNDESSFDGVYRLSFLGNDILVQCSENNEIFICNLKTNETKKAGQIPSFTFCDCAVVGGFDSGKCVVVGGRTDGRLHKFEIERCLDSGNLDTDGDGNGYSEITVGDENNGGHDFVWSLNKNFDSSSNVPYAVSFQQRRSGEKAWFYDLPSNVSYSYTFPSPHTTSRVFGCSFANSGSLLTAHTNSAMGETVFRTWDVRNLTESTSNITVTREFSMRGYYGGLQSSL